MTLHITPHHNDRTQALTNLQPVLALVAETYTLTVDNDSIDTKRTCDLAIAARPLVQNPRLATSDDIRYSVLLPLTRWPGTMMAMVTFVETHSLVVAF